MFIVYSKIKRHTHTHNSAKVNVQEQSNLQRHSAIRNLYGRVYSYFKQLMPQFAQRTTTKPFKENLSLTFYRNMY